jgi:hypothetical protein
MRSVVENNTLQETWSVEPDSPAQWSHCALAPIFVLYQDLIGLRPLAPGFTRLQLRPQLGDLPDLEAIAHTPRGPVSFRSKLDGDVHRIEVALPRGCEAELVLPAGAAAPFPSLATDERSGVKRYRLPDGGGKFEVPVGGKK